MAQPTRETTKKTYAQPTLERREQLTELTEGVMVVATTGLNG